MLGQDPGRVAAGCLLHDGQQQVLGRDVLVVQPLGDGVGTGQDVASLVRKAELRSLAGDPRQVAQPLAQRLRDGRRVLAGLLQDGRHHAIGLVDQGQQQVGGRQLGMALALGQLLRGQDRLLGPRGEAFGAHRSTVAGGRGRVRDGSVSAIQRLRAARRLLGRASLGRRSQVLRRRLVRSGCAMVLLVSSIGNVSAARPGQPWLVRSWARVSAAGRRCGRWPRRVGGGCRVTRAPARGQARHRHGQHEDDAAQDGARRVGLPPRRTLGGGRPGGAGHVAGGGASPVRRHGDAGRFRRRASRPLEPAGDPDLRRHVDRHAVRHPVRRHQRGRRQDHRLRLRDVLPGAPGRQPIGG